MRARGFPCPAAGSYGCVATTQDRVTSVRAELPADQDAAHDTVSTAMSEAAATDGLGRPGRPIDRRSPFFVGMAAAAGVAVTIGLVELVIRARSVLVLIGLAFFIAAGLDCAVGWVTRRGLPRWVAVCAVLLAVAGVFAAFVFAAIPLLTSQTAALTSHLPHYLRTLRDPRSELGRLNLHYHIEQRLTQLIASRGGAVARGVVGGDDVVLSTAASLLVVIMLTGYFLAGMPRIKRFLYHLAPRSRRTRVILIGDEIFTKVGGYLLGNALTSVVAGVGTYVWMLAFGIPYPVLLGMLVALLDLVPVIGSTIGGIIVTLVALTVSVPVAGFTLAFYVAFRIAEDYLLIPRIMTRTVQVPAVATIVAVLLGAALLGIIGALVAIPVAASVRLLLQEVTFHRMDQS